MTLQILALRPDATELHTATIEELPALIADERTIVWVDMSDPGETEKKLLEEVFQLHPLVVEDMLADAPTPKAERFEGYLYLVFHSLILGAEKKGIVETCDFDFFIGPNWLVSSRPENSSAARMVHELVRKKPLELRKGAAFICYLMVEEITDRYLPLMDVLDNEIDELETQIVKGPGPKVLEQVFGLKHKLQRLRRVGLHQKEILSRLGRGDYALIPEEVRPFFRDAYDHFVRVVDLNDSFRELVNGAMEAYISINGHKMNEVMKVLTLSSTIMLPLTFIAGLYGMNFEVMP